MSLVIVASVVLQFHHHDIDGDICLYTHSHCECLHFDSNPGPFAAHDHGSAPAEPNASCSLHLDKFVGEKHHFCADTHCALHFAPIIIPVADAAPDVHYPDFQARTPQPPEIRSTLLRAPPTII